MHHIMHRDSLRYVYNLLQVNVGSIAPITAIQVCLDVECIVSTAQNCLLCCLQREGGRSGIDIMQLLWSSQ